MGKELKYPLADARGSVVMPVQKIVLKNKKFQRSATTLPDPAKMDLYDSKDSRAQQPNFSETWDS
jgi:hypothetical protein